MTERTQTFATERLILFMAAAVAASMISRLLPAQWPWAPVAIAAIAVAIWHGAFDGVLAEQVLLPRWGASWKPAFYGSYLAVTAGILLLWWAVPILALVLFLLYSAVHFGTEGERHLTPGRLLTGAAVGLVPIAAACRWWPAQVGTIFGEMLRGDSGHAAQLASIAGRTLWPVAALALISTATQRGHRAAASLLILTELMLFRACSPLAAFAIFFCLWHTPEHMVSTSLDGTGRFQPRLLFLHLQRGLVPWLLSLCGMAALFWFGRHSLQAYLGVLFTSLSALTVPHMLLGEVCRRWENDVPVRTRARQIAEGAVARV